MSDPGRDELMALLEPTVEALGYELADMEVSLGRGAGMLRLFIDSPDGIGLEDCEAVSRQVSALLDVEDPISSDYSLEVSSPGLDRKLVKPEHFERFAGETVRLKMKRLYNGRKRVKGVLAGLENNEVVVEFDKGRYSAPLEEIDTARVVPDV